MEAVTVSQLPSTSAKRKRDAYNSFIPMRWKAIVAYHLAGYTLKEIAELTGYHYTYISILLHKPAVQHYRQQLLATTEQEFEALFSDVVAVIRKGLASPDEAIRLSAAEKWLKAHAKYGGGAKSTEGDSVTAEDVVKLILNGPTQVNITNNGGGGSAK